MAVVTPEEQPPRSGGCSPLLVVLAFIIVVVALYVGVQVLGVLYGIVMPPMPPLPGGVSEVSHQSSAYGVDMWEYTTPDEPCTLVHFYEIGGGMCSVALNQCGREGSESVEWPAFAHCSGEMPFSNFNMRWSVTVYPDDTAASRLDVRREVFWIGTGPETTPRMDFSQLSSSPNAPSAP